MKNQFFKFIFAVLLALSLLGGATIQATAARFTGKYITVLTLAKMPNVSLTQPFTVSGYFKTWYGAPIANTDVSFTINGIKLGQTRTNSAGYFQRKFVDKFNAGTYTIAASTKPYHFLFAAKASTSLLILPVDVRVQTVPAIPGIAFDLAGNRFLSGPDGVAVIKFGSVGKFELRVLPDQYSNPDQRIEFARWLDETFQTSQIIKVPSQKLIQVGLNVYQKVGETFVDLGGYPVEPQRIAQFTIRSAQGDLFTFKDGQPRWIPASRIARFQNGLVATPLMYSVINMMVDGSNVVNKAQQRFFAHPNDTWQISAILYSLSVRANDGLFGSSVGKSINLVYPDGHSVNYPFDKTGAVVIHALARGNYTVEVLDTKGLKQVIPVALSRSQTVDIHVPTTLDLITIISLGLFVALGLIVVGHFQARRPPSIRNMPAFPGTQPALITSRELLPVKQEVDLPDKRLVKWS